MIIQQQIDEILVHIYSDQGVYIHGGFPEADYIDVITRKEYIDNGERTYVETNIPIPVEEQEEESQEEESE